MTIRFHLNGQEICAKEVDPHTTLLHFLRAQGWTGTKEGCAEGECGACAVVFVRSDKKGKTHYVPINSCLVLLASVDGQEVLTVEGVAIDDELHPVQKAMVEKAGSQCGYCTPGFVMSLFSEFYRRGRNANDADYESIAGNLCRCTGYRPIRDVLVELGTPQEGDFHAARLEKEAPRQEMISYEHSGVHYERPTSLEACFDILQTHTNTKIIAGGTDAVVEINQHGVRWNHFLSLDAIPELQGIESNENEIRIGATTPLSDIEKHLHEDIPILGELFALFSSRLIRNRATLGGNLANASPIGDGAPALMALNASVEVRSQHGCRIVLLADFFRGYRETELQPGEILSAVLIPKPLPKIQRFYKVSKRVLDDISTVAAGFSIWQRDGKIKKARLAYGGVAATPIRAYKAENALLEHQLDEKCAERIRPHLESAFTPLSDHRGSAEYRSAMVMRLFEKFVFESLAS